MTAVDRRGRIADQSLVRSLGWRPGDTIRVSVADHVITIEAVADGELTVHAHGRVDLPAAVRHACAIGPGDRVLLAAEPSDGVLVVHPVASLDAMLDALTSGSEPA